MPLPNSARTRTRSPRLTPNRNPYYLARIEADLTQEEAARRSGVSTRQIGRIEAGKVGNPHPVTRRALTEVYKSAWDRHGDVPRETRQMSS